MAKNETLAVKPIYNGLIFDISQRTVRLPNGKEALRDVMEMTGAAAMIPVMEDGRILFVRQYRDAAGVELLELPAGKLDKGENPVEGALRELAEETGYKAARMQFLFSFYPAAAYNTEQLYVYLAEGLTPGNTSPDEDEFLSLESYDLEAALAMIDNGTIIDAKTIAGLLFYARKKQKMI